MALTGSRLSPPSSFAGGSGSLPKRGCGPRAAQELGNSYKSNFGTSAAAANAAAAADGVAANAPLVGTTKGVEAVVVGVVYKRVVARVIERFSWIRSGENVSLYADVRALMNYVKISHGSVFRRVVLSALLESTQKIVKVEAM